MTWWYENEEDMPRKITLVDYDKEGKPFHRDVVVPKTAEEARRLEMEFDKSRVFSSVNADELKQGDKVIAADSIAELKSHVKDGFPVDTLLNIEDEANILRFNVHRYAIYALAYLVERKENCTNCGENCPRAGNININIKENIIHTCSKWLPITEKKCIDCKHYAIDYCCKNHHVTVNDNKACADFDDITVKIDRKVYEYYNTKTEPHYRPFRDTDELIKVWDAKIGTPKWGTDGDLTMPHIWIRRKEANTKGQLITEFSDELHVSMGKEGYNMFDLFLLFTFLDGSVCGVEA